MLESSQKMTLAVTKNAKPAGEKGRIEKRVTSDTPKLASGYARIPGGRKQRQDAPIQRAALPAEDILLWGAATEATVTAARRVSTLSVETRLSGGTLQLLLLQGFERRAGSQPTESYATSIEVRNTVDSRATTPPIDWWIEQYQLCVKTFHNPRPRTNHWKKPGGETHSR
jgi:hypothetical protein